jgi:hypothetical protein
MVCFGASNHKPSDAVSTGGAFLAWRTLADAEIAVLIGMRNNVERTGVGIIVGVIDHNGCREAVA